MSLGFLITISTYFTQLMCSIQKYTNYQTSYWQQLHALDWDADVDLTSHLMDQQNSLWLLYDIPHYLDVEPSHQPSSLYHQHHQRQHRHHCVSVNVINEIISVVTVTVLIIISLLSLWSLSLLSSSSSSSSLSLWFQSSNWTSDLFSTYSYIFNVN